MTDWLVDVIDWLNNINWLIVKLINWLIDGLIDWLIDLMDVGELSDIILLEVKPKLIDWLINWLID